MTAQEPNYFFQVQRVDTTRSVSCSKCKEKIDYLVDSEHVVIWVGIDTIWRLHFECFGIVVAGMVAFLEEVIIKDQKKKPVLQ